MSIRVGTRVLVTGFRCWELCALQLLRLRGFENSVFTALMVVGLTLQSSSLIFCLR